MRYDDLGQWDFMRPINRQFPDDDGFVVWGKIGERVAVTGRRVVNLSIRNSLSTTLINLKGTK